MIFSEQRERTLIIVHYTGTKIGDRTPFDHLGVITKNFQCNNPFSSRLTLTQVIEILLDDPKKHDQVFGDMPGSSKIERGEEVVSLTLFVSDYESVIKSSCLTPSKQSLPHKDIGDSSATGF
ncbi:hypothetical protein [Nostoc sp. TCL240-02]|uniref:hypothetical protein n=1 Tax=Nostoc sp. TCL240-02 TaxID=2572090 RepID=UPI00157F821C|nr:hypothetical protein [Nostoc sp. TCL240-02]QKQ75594.1 hypothetical protein FBB35_21940 [Nostoc sp. TCL240-02]